MASGPSTQKSQTTMQAGLAPWAQPVAKDVVGWLLNYMQPGATVPSDWFSAKGFSFPTGGGGFSSPSQQQAQQNIQNSPLQSVLNDPVMNALFSPSIAGSPYLQNIAANNPAAIYGAISPAAAQQLGGQYGPQSMAGLSWIPNFNPSGPGAPAATPSQWSWPYATGGTPFHPAQTAGSQQVG